MNLLGHFFTFLTTFMKDCIKELRKKIISENFHEYFHWKIFLIKLYRILAYTQTRISSTSNTQHIKLLLRLFTLRSISHIKYSIVLLAATLICQTNYRKGYVGLLLLHVLLFLYHWLVIERWPALGFSLCQGFNFSKMIHEFF